MSTSRRDFLKTSMVAGAVVALPRMQAMAASGAEPHGQIEAEPGAPGSAAAMNAFTRGVGMYPGAPAENFSPDLVPDTPTYRNLALLRPAYHSSSYDYNLTAQLVTDGIKDTRMPDWVSTSLVAVGPLPKTEREMLLDHFPTTTIELKGATPSVQVQLGGGGTPPEADRIAVFVVLPDAVDPAVLTISISVSEDGRLWKQVGQVTGLQSLPPVNFPPDLVRGQLLFNPMIALEAPVRSRYYQVKCGVDSTAVSTAHVQWKMGQVAFYKGSERVQIGGPYSFTSAWMSAGLSEEWVYVDLGARCDIDRVALYWIAKAASGSIQVSDDAHSWRDLQPLPGGTAMVDYLRLAQPAQGRYVRVLMKQPASANGYILSEVEVFGRGGFVARPKPAPAMDSDGRMLLAGGAWRVQRSSVLSAKGEDLSRPGFKDADWVTATVPGTVLTSYVNAGAVQDPNYGQNQLHISDSFFYSDFWYRTEFTAPKLEHGQLAWLNFDGINWKADVFLNGSKIGRIEGGFMRGRFDVTGKLQPGAVNALAVKIEKNATPGSVKQKTYQTPGKNGGAPGADNPTYHASIGWDWIPTIRGRNTGIWGDVSLNVTGEVTLENPFVQTVLPLPDTASADVKIEVDVVNHQTKSITGTLRGHFGSVPFEEKVTVEGGTRKTVKLDPSTHPALHLQNPQLWWPVGYGEPHLYDVEMAFEVKRGKPTDRKMFKAGVRQMTSSEAGGKLTLFVNGRRFVARGGNWGFGESMLLYRAREYDAAVRHHREMNFTMVRNWVGQIGDDAFYEACDRHGVMVWQDFWLANPWDGPIPNDDQLFMSNVKDTVLRIRNHASMGLYCGRNEGYPPKSLDDGIRQVLSQYHPDLHYIGSSADDVVSGHGPYMALPPAYYFRTADPKLHSEIGMPNIPSLESVQLMMPESAIWPQGLDWGLHDFCLEGAQAGNTFRTIIEQSYGGATSAEEWIELAQFLNYEGYRAMFEAQSKYRMGLLLWMSHPCWPSFVWQTYDYYLEPTSAYYGCKKASEPIHIQWNRTTEAIEVVNYSGGNLQGLSVTVDVLNMDGAKMATKTASLDSREDSTIVAIQMEYPAGLTPVHFLRMTLNKGADVLSTNFYLRGLEEDNYRAIRQLAKAQVKASTSAVQQGEEWVLTTQLENASSTPALMTRLKAVRERTGDRILPVFYDDNYVALMPSERRTITTRLHHVDTRGERPTITVGGFNIAAVS